MTSETVFSQPAPSKEPLAMRIGDWLNPIVVKELRQAVQSRLLWRRC